jgi:hypothetical protein
MQVKIDGIEFNLTIPKEPEDTGGWVIYYATKADHYHLENRRLKKEIKRLEKIINKLIK